MQRDILLLTEMIDAAEQAFTGGLREVPHAPEQRLRASPDPYRALVPVSAGVK